MKWTIESHGNRIASAGRGASGAMNVITDKMNRFALLAFSPLLLLFAATVAPADGAEENTARGLDGCVKGATANELADDSAETGAKEKAQGAVYLLHLAKFPGIGHNAIWLAGKGDTSSMFKSLFSCGFFGWEFNIWRADDVTLGKYEFKAGLGHEGLGPEWYECKPVTVSQVPCVFWDCVRFVPVPVTCEVDLPKADNRLLFGYMVTEKVDAGDKPRCHLFPGYTGKSKDLESLLWLNEEITDLRFRFVFLRGRYGAVAGKELLLGGAKSLRGKKIRVSVQYDDDEDDSSRQKEVEILQMRIPVSNAVQCTVTITSPDGHSRVLR